MHFRLSFWLRSNIANYSLLGYLNIDGHLVWHNRYFYLSQSGEKPTEKTKIFPSYTLQRTQKEINLICNCLCEIHFKLFIHTCTWAYFHWLSCFIHWKNTYTPKYNRIGNFSPVRYLPCITEIALMCVVCLVISQTAYVCCLNSIIYNQEIFNLEMD